MSKISYRVKDLNDGTFLNNDGSNWDSYTFTSFATLEEAKNAVKEWGGFNYKLVIVKVTTKPVSTTTHDWNWAQKQLHKGKKVRRLDWTNSSIWIATRKWGQIFILDYTPNELEFTYNAPDCTATDWVLFKP